MQNVSSFSRATIITFRGVGAKKPVTDFAPAAPVGPCRSCSDCRNGAKRYNLVPGEINIAGNGPPIPSIHMAEIS